MNFRLRLLLVSEASARIFRMGNGNVPEWHLFNFIFTGSRVSITFWVLFRVLLIHSRNYILGQKNIFYLFRFLYRQIIPEFQNSNHTFLSKKILKCSKMKRMHLPKITDMFKVLSSFCSFSISRMSNISDPFFLKCIL